jgi:hypothetical protein
MHFPGKLKLVALAAGGLALLTVAIVSCVGDSASGVAVDSDSGATAEASTTGGEGQPCYANGTCNGSLSCVSKVCVNLSSDSGGGGGQDGSVASDGSASDGSTDGGSGGGNVDAAALCFTGHVPKLDAKGCALGSGGSVLCTKDLTCAANIGACNPQNALSCIVNSDCGGAFKCCAEAPGTGTLCPTVNDILITSCVAGGGFNGGCAAAVDALTCTQDSDCAASTPHCLPVLIAGRTQTIGVCHP